MKRQTEIAMGRKLKKKNGQTSHLKKLYLKAKERKEWRKTVKIFSVVPQ